MMNSITGNINVLEDWKTIKQMTGGQRLLSRRQANVLPFYFVFHLLSGNSRVSMRETTFS